MKVESPVSAVLDLGASFCVYYKRITYSKWVLTSKLTSKLTYADIIKNINNLNLRPMVNLFIWCDNIRRIKKKNINKTF